MNSSSPKGPRPLAVLLAFICSVFLTGCGGGGGGGSGFISPTGPTPTTTGTVEGYVSTARLNPAGRANLAAAITAPARGAQVQLFALAPDTGAEVLLGSTSTDDQGYYQLTFTSNLAILRNLIVRATANGTSFAALLPKVENGRMVRAPTMDPDSELPVKIVLEAAKVGKHHDLNLGELLAILPPTALKELETKIAELVRNLVAREQAKQQKFGARLPQLRQLAFDLQQRINEAIEKGELSAAEGWKLFTRELAARAEKLGFSAADLQTLDDLDQTFVFEPFRPDFADLDDYETIAADRLKERKLRFLGLVAESVKILAGAKAQTSYTEFFALVDKISAALQAARTPADIHRFFTDNGQMFLTFGKYLSSALLEVKFTPDLVRRVFAIPVPAYGFGIAEMAGPAYRKEAGAGTAVPSRDQMQTVMAPQGDPAGRALGFLKLQEEFLARLIEEVQRVAREAALALTPEQAKAVAYIIWAQSEENLNFPPPPVPGEPDPYPITLAGKVEALASPVTETVGSGNSAKTFKFTHQLVGTDFCTILAGPSTMSSSGGTEPGFAPGPVPPTVLAYLAQGAEKITLVKMAADGQTSKSLVDLADLTGYEFLEIEGMVVKSPYQPMPMPMPVEPSDPILLIGLNNSHSQGSSGVSSSGSGSSEPGDPGLIPDYEVGPIYLVVTVARVLPPPPPPPSEFQGITGKVLQAYAGAKPVPGMYVFSCSLEKYDGAILVPPYTGLDTVTQLSLAKWVNQTVTISGILFTEGERKTIQLWEIK
ncbi:MAG: hypothetical protein OZSIB_1559 [Candidatus Ozemobacter sibiricus]|uniref:Uncharacterized protein n=1 Tax=Candidatus Ozemobacter sibiricus TaxID=2268124 RepID=A0A367ZKD4_9BACT|nr:MAG: hypothetical protein OZSIB_1559 [Candidatus Ozemobacter sibiricus]